MCVFKDYIQLNGFSAINIYQVVNCVKLFYIFTDFFLQLILSVTWEDILNSPTIIVDLWLFPFNSVQVGFVFCESILLNHAN